MRSRPALRLLLLATIASGAAGCVSLRPYSEAVDELPDGRLLEIDGQKVSVERAGEGEPLVLLHGFGESTAAYAGVLPELSRRFAVVAIDLNGFGYTERPRDPARYSLEGQADLVLAVLDRLGLGRVRLAGHSYGGGLALYLAARHPERVDRLLLIDNTLPLYFTQQRKSFVRWRWMASLAARTWALSDSRIRKGLIEAYFDDTKVTPALVGEYASRLRIEGAADAFFGLVGHSEEAPFELDLRTIAVPSLVVWGAEDALIPMSAAEARSRLMPRGAFVSIPACGHTPMEECPDAFMSQVLPFLESPDAAAATSDPASSDR
jgi:pimeloyl-ACP methyl ester carboxylesterase